MLVIFFYTVLKFIVLISNLKCFLFTGDTILRIYIKCELNLNSHVVVFELKLLISFSLELKIKLSIRIKAGFNME